MPANPVLRRIKQIGRKRGASPKEIKAAIETGIVESGLRNLPGGDADSAGWRQERASLYKDPQNLDASINRFFDETSAVKDKYGTAGALAAAVQRPAAQYRGRYQEVSERAQSMMGGATPAGTSVGTRTITTPGTPAGPLQTPDGASRGDLLKQYLATRGQEGSTLALAGGLGSLTRTPATPATTRTVRTASEPGGERGGSAALDWATTKIGSKETGNNSGGLASYANQRFGMRNQPWCAMFTSLAVTKGGAPSSARTASVAQVLQKARAGDGYAKGFVSPRAARAGDLITFGTRHIGMVDSVKPNGRIVMVAGNDSDGVQRREVDVGRDVKIVRPKYTR